MIIIDILKDSAANMVIKAKVNENKPTLLKGMLIWTKIGAQL